MEMSSKSGTIISSVVKPEKVLMTSISIGGGDKDIVKSSEKTPNETSTSCGGGGGHNGTHTGPSPNISDPDYIIGFIRRVKSLPVLYDQEDENFRNTSVKLKTWQIIADEMNQDVNWCMKKWVSLRDYFVKRKKLLRMGKPARAWIYYNELTFLNIIYGNDDVEFYPSETTEETNSNVDSSFNYSTYSNEFIPVTLINNSRKSDRKSHHHSVSLVNVNSIIDHDTGDGEDRGEEEFSPNNPQEDDHQDHYHYAYDNSLEVNWNEDDNIHRNGIEIVRIPRETDTSTANNEMTSSSDAFSSTSSAAIRNGRKKSRLSSDVHLHNPHHHNTSNYKRIKVEMTPNIQSRLPIPSTEKDDDDGSGGDGADEVLHGADEDVQENDANGIAVKLTNNPYDLFCLSIAAHMRNMNRDKAMRLQIQIMNLVYETEFPENHS